MKVSQMLMLVADCRAPPQAESFVRTMESTFLSVRRLAGMVLKTTSSRFYEEDKLCIHLELVRHYSPAYGTTIAVELTGDDMTFTVATVRQCDGAVPDNSGTFQAVFTANAAETVNQAIRQAISLAQRQQESLMTLVGVPGKYANLVARDSWKPQNPC